MSQVPSIPTVIQVAKIAQYLYNRAIDGNKFYNRQPVDPNRPILLYITRKDVEFLYAQNPSSPNLFSISSYLFGLCAPYIQQALQIINNISVAAPVITGPSNQSVNVGANATFSVTVTGVSPFSYQWYDYLGSPISGANGPSYTLTNAQLTDTGHTFFVKVTDANGKSTVSNTATLTVTAVITGFFLYSDSDPYPAIAAHVDNFTYPVSFSITHNTNPTIPISGSASPNKYLLAKIPIGEPIYIKWQSGSENFGDIPDSVFEAVEQFGGFSYYASRGQVTMDPTSGLTLKIS